MHKDDIAFQFKTPSEMLCGCSSSMCTGTLLSMIAAALAQYHIIATTDLSVHTDSNTVHLVTDGMKAKGECSTMSSNQRSW